MTMAFNRNKWKQGQTLNLSLMKSGLGQDASKGRLEQEA